MPEHDGDADFQELMSDIRGTADEYYKGFDAMPADLYARIVKSAADMDIEIKNKKGAANIFAWVKRFTGFVSMLIPK